MVLYVKNREFEEFYVKTAGSKRGLQKQNISPHIDLLMYYQIGI